MSLVAKVKSHHVITFHMDDVYSPHIHFHLLTIRIKFSATHHYLQLCYNPLQSAMWQHTFFKIMFLNYILDLHQLLDGVKSCHMAC